MTDIKHHPAANLFPMMSEDQFQQLKADIKEHGQREDIVFSHDNLLVDGRNRMRACNELSIEPETCELMEETDIVAYVISHNLHRRHLTTNQRACVAAKLATLKNGQAGIGTSNDAPTQDNAAALLNVSVPALQRAKHVIENGSSAVVDAVESDEVTASLAYKFIGLCEDKRDQAKTVREGVKAVRDYVKGKGPDDDAPDDVQPATSKPRAVSKPVALSSESLANMAAREILQTVQPFLRLNPAVDELEPLMVALAEAQTLVESYMAEGGTDD